jgi:hypothetical protein
MLVREVTLTPLDLPQRATRIQVLWETGATTELTVPRPDKVMAQATAPEALERLRQIAPQGTSNGEIAEQLNRDGLRTGHQHPWTAQSVGFARRRHRLGRPPQR